MSTISLLAVVSGKREQLHRLLKGVARQSIKPLEVVVVFIDEPVPDVLPDTGCPVYLRSLPGHENGLPTAAARNLAASTARGELIAFIETDYIPHSRCLEELETAIELTHGLVMGEVLDLPESFTEDHLTDATLEAQLSSDKLADSSANVADSLVAIPHEDFRSAIFGLRATDYARIGGYDELYRGYGAEDTDFAFSAQAIKLQLFHCAARAYRMFTPPPPLPYAHVEELVANAANFYHKWQIWPMRKLLRIFDREGLIVLTKNDIQLAGRARLPAEREDQ